MLSHYSPCHCSDDPELLIDKPVQCCFIPSDNGAILTVAQIMKAVMSSAAEAELAALYINAREAVYIRQILEAMGHKQPPTPIQTDNSTAVGIVNNIILPKATKAMDIRFHWLRCWEAQKLFRFF